MALNGRYKQLHDKQYHIETTVSVNPVRIPPEAPLPAVAEGESSTSALL